jgi:class 3 adenylate cyclase
MLTPARASTRGLRFNCTAHFRRQPNWEPTVAKSDDPSGPTGEAADRPTEPHDAAPAAPGSDPTPHLMRGFLFADLRDYTGYIEARGDHAGAILLERYRALVRDAVASARGAEVRTEGDSFYVVFDSASAAVRTGLQIVAAAAAADPADPIRVGVGIHAGETVEVADGFVGSAVNIAARLCAEAKPGEVVVSDTVRGLTRTYLDVDFEPLGARRLKGLSEPIPVYRAVPRGTVPVRARPRRAAGRSRWLLAGAAVVALVLVVGAAGAVALRGIGASPTAAPGLASQASPTSAVEPTGTPQASPVATFPSSAAPTAPTDAFPNAAEQALLTAVRDVPAGFAATCRRGPYDPVGDEIPVASLECSPGVETGANEVIVRQFGRSPSGDSSGWGRIERRVIRKTPGSWRVAVAPGDCATSRQAYGDWTVGAEKRGWLICYVESDTGDALLEWTYDPEEILVAARNQRGDSSALYGFFKRVARFIAP